MKTLKDHQRVQPTPGPWEISKNSEYVICGYDPRCYPDNERVTVAKSDPMGDSIPADVGIANARLIAAAPELLTYLKAQICVACRTCLSEPKDHSEPCLCDPAREAIAKAEGTK